MTTPIETFQDILDVLEQNPEYREAMRRHILDEEIRRLPAEFRELRETVDSLAQVVRDYIKTTNERLSRMEADVAELKEGQGRLEAGQASLEVRQGRLEAGQASLEVRQGSLEAGFARLEGRQESLEAGFARLEGRQASLEGRQESLEAGFARLEGRVGDVAGTAYERRIVRHCRSIVSRRLGIKRAKILRSINVQEHEALDLLVANASETGSITDEQVYDLDLADIIITGAADPGQAGYAVIEVSETIDDSDVDRAHERAAILAIAVSEPVAAAVIGKAISDANRQRAAQGRVTVIIMAE